VKDILDDIKDLDCEGRESLRPGDQLMEMNGVKLSGKSFGEICEVIRSLSGEERVLKFGRQIEEEESVSVVEEISVDCVNEAGFDEGFPILSRVEQRLQEDWDLGVKKIKIRDLTSYYLCRSYLGARKQLVS